MTLIPHFPRLLLREKSHSWNLLGVVATPGVTNNVANLVRSDGGGFWSCVMNDVTLSGAGSARGRDRQRISTLLWRAVRQICDGGANRVVVWRNDAGFRPWPEGVAQGVPAPIPHSDDTFFSDGTGYYQSKIDVTAAAASLRDTSLDLTLNVCAPLIGGECFSIQHTDVGWRLYEIATVTYDEDDDTQATITFNPPLRGDIAANMRLEFDRPRCVMRLKSPSSMDLSVQPWTFNQASVDFVETF